MWNSAKFLALTCFSCWLVVLTQNCATVQQNGIHDFSSTQNKHSSQKFSEQIPHRVQTLLVHCILFNSASCDSLVLCVKIQYNLDCAMYQWWVETSSSMSGRAVLHMSIGWAFFVYFKSYITVGPNWRRVAKNRKQWKML